MYVVVKVIFLREIDFGNTCISFSIIQRMIKYQKSTLNNTLYTVSEFDLPIDLHMGREISNASKDGLLTLLQLPISKYW